MKDWKEFTRSAGVVGALTLLSRIMGYVRDMVIAYLFGARAETDAFYVAFRIPNLLRRLLAEGSLTISFIPVFTESLEKKGKEDAKRVSDITFTIIFTLLIVVSLAGVLLSPLIIKLFASGFKEDIFSLAVNLNRIMFPYIFFASLTALSMGVLNSLKHFFAPAISPVVFNIVLILTVILLQQSLQLPILALAIGVMIGGLIQVLFQIPFLKSRGFLFGFRRNLRDPAVKKIALLMTPQLFGLAVYNLNILVSTQYASYMPEGTVSYLYYSERLIEFPLGIIAVSIATVLLPSLSSLASKKEFEEFRESYSFALRLMLFIMAPALAGLIALKVPICNLLYQRGEFTGEATLFTSQALFGYAFGLWAVGGVRITAPTFYAMQDTKTPVLIALFSFIVNAAFGFILGFALGLKHTGLALASSISSIFNFALLFFVLNRRTGKMELKKILIYCIKIAFASVIMAVLAWKISTFSEWSQSGVSARKLVVFLISFFGAIAAYLALARILRIQELHFLLSTLRRKVN